MDMDRAMQHILYRYTGDFLTPVKEVHGVKRDVVILLLGTNWFKVLYPTAGILHVLSCISKAIMMPKVKPIVKVIKMWDAPLPQMITTPNLWWDGCISIHNFMHHVLLIREMSI